MKVVSVNPLEGYRLHVVFEDGVSGTIELKDFISRGIFSVLKDEQLFGKAYATDYAIAWNDELEIDSLSVYAEILNIKPEEILTTHFTHASN